MDREKVLKYGISVFNHDVDKFSSWILKTNVDLNGKTPNELLHFEEGLLQVKNCLNRIEHKVFS